MDLFERIPALRHERRGAVLVTVVKTLGSTPRKPGARMLVLDNGGIEGSIGGGVVEHVLRSAAERVLKTRQPELVHHTLTAELGMCCGGQMTFFVEPIVSNPTLIVLGCGHVGAAVIYAAANLAFDIVAVDDLDENANQERLPHAKEIVRSYERDAIDALPFGDDTYVIIATREHALDQKLLELCLRHTHAYVGVIGSPRKAKLQRERLAAKGFSQEDIERVNCPVGLDIGAQTPEEIAVSVCAELVSRRRGGPRFADGRA